MNKRDNRVYKLNSSWQTIDKMSLKAAFHIVYKGRAIFMDKDTGETFGYDAWLQKDPGECFVYFANQKVSRPSHIVLKYYNGQGTSPKIQDPCPSRWNFYVRDNASCQYCGKKLPYQKGGFTFDHVHPKSKGGDKDWTNIVIACHHCNRSKENKSIEESGMKLLSVPKKPTAEELRSKAIKIRQQIWKEEESSFV